MSKLQVSSRQIESDNVKILSAKHFITNHNSGTVTVNVKAGETARDLL